MTSQPVTVSDPLKKPSRKAKIKEIFAKKKTQDRIVFWLFLAPIMIPFLFMVMVPFVMGTYYSFTDWSGRFTVDVNWVGLENYRGLLEGPRARFFVYAFVRTFLYAGLNVVLINFVAFALAMLVVQKLKLKNLYRAGFFMPNLIGGLILGYIWQFIYDEALTTLGTANVVQWVETMISWNPFGRSALVGANSAMIALLIVITWQYAGYIMMIYIAALQNVPQDLIEASKIDGANSWQRLRTITLPLVAQAFTVAMFLTLVTAFKQYDTVVSLTRGGPSLLSPQWLMDFVDMNPPPRPVQSTRLITLDIYETGYINKNFAVGQAKAILFFMILAVIALVQVYFNKKREVEL